MPTLDDDFVSVDMARLLALHGFDGKCRRFVGIGHRMTTYKAYDATNQYFQTGNQSLKNNVRYYWSSSKRIDEELPILVARRKLLNGYDLKRVMKYSMVIVPTYDMVEKWFTEIYGIDFVKIPRIGDGRIYVCNPIGGGLGQVQLPELPDLTEARIQCINYLLKNTKPLVFVQPKPVLLKEDAEIEES